MKTVQQKPRPPVVVILGHVDHGKTTLLDYIRKSHIAEKEYGRITQSIGAWEIDTGIKGYNTSKITFIDTPGHEAFVELRARGAKVADIAILIIDAKESVKPQTVESIYHIKQAKIPFIVAVNKIDLPEANPKKVYLDLQKHGVIVESLGGEVVAVEISAKTGQGVKDLLEAVLLLSSDKGFVWDEKSLEAYIIETKKDKRGPVASAIVKNGVLKVGEFVYLGEGRIKVRGMFDDLGKPVKEAFPSKPVEILGFEELPPVGALLSNKPYKLEKEERKISQPSSSSAPFDIEEIFGKKEEGKKLPLVIRADTQGSLDAILGKLTKNDKFEIVLAGVGPITKADVFLAKTSKAIVLGFNVEPTEDAEAVSRDLKVPIRTYRLIYELFEEIEEVVELLEKKEEEKRYKGEVKILAIFIIEGKKVYGGRVVKGKIELSDEVIAFRGEREMGRSRLVSLRIRAKPVKEVKAGSECGLLFEPALDLKEGDVVKSIL